MTAKLDELLPAAEDFMQYRLKVEIIDFPAELPGDVSMTLKWG